MHDYDALMQALDTLERGLRNSGVWSPAPPLASALESRMPFCCDKMSLQEWLQWMLLPRLRALVDARGVLPARSNIAPYAEVVWPATPPYDALVVMLRDIDALLLRAGTESAGD